MKTLLKILIGVVLGAVLAVVAVYSVNSFKIAEKGETAITNVTIEHALSDVAELATEEYSFSDIGKFDQEGWKLLGDITIPFTGKSFAISYDGVIKAGIRDMSAVKVEQNDVTKVITITSRDVEVLDAYLDSASYQTMDQTFNPFNQVSTEDVTELLSGEVERAKEDALGNGILDKAREHAEQVLVSHTKALITGTGLEHYTVRVNWVAE